VLFAVETLLIAVPVILLRFESLRLDLPKSFILLVTLCIGGMIYRYAPTTLAFMPGPGYRYFPSVIELLISMGFMALGILGYLFTVKRFPILPATLEMSLADQAREERRRMVRRHADLAQQTQKEQVA
jgi:Ni/Fe-hydrogenase subunit HybB-like protein